MHDLCVIVVSHNGRRWLDAGLASVCKHASGLELDLVVVDNGTDGAADYIEEHFPGVRVIRCPDESFGHAKNRALETAAAARYVLFLNADIEILEGSLGALIAMLDNRPRVALVGAQQLRGDGTLAPSIRRCEWTSGFTLVRGVALEKSGWFDERFLLFSEETDLCWRLKRAGWETLHTPRITSRRHERDRRENAQLEAHAAYSRMQFARKHFPRVAAEYRLVLAFLYALRVGLYSLLRRYGSDRRQAARAALVTVLKGRIPLDEQSAF